MSELFLAEAEEELLMQSVTVIGSSPAAVNSSSGLMSRTRPPNSSALTIRSTNQTVPL